MPTAVHTELTAEVVPEPVLQVLERTATLRRPPGHHDEDARRRYLDRIGQ